MALPNTAALSSKSLIQSQVLLPAHHSTSFPCNQTPAASRRHISAVHAAEPAKTPVIATTKPTVAPPAPAPSAAKWAPDTWKNKNALQLPKYPDEAELESVLKTMEAYPPLVFAGEVRSLEERLAEAHWGKPSSCKVGIALRASRSSVLITFVTLSESSSR
ncbi:UNVERIFIED_CONTAM: Phospho-2-dehydro-3-deoxyheptonate aldolase 2, chloroplastic [Sesamum radiatum]|uniref:Phospho-2-dehydro-3-deoxyheptonate aldolase n=1 Tax=Sesamum radiatum TaxID=300843 RepID=A0AAW2V417_SESRA